MLPPVAVTATLTDVALQNTAVTREGGGQAFYDRNAIKDAVANAIRNGGNYYTLAYTPENTKFDGKFRKVQVTLPGQGH
jgi:hypothetical protein